MSPHAESLHAELPNPTGYRDVAGIEDLERVVADALRLKPEFITDDLSFRAVSEWDSLAHVRLMLEIEARYGIRITGDRVVSLTSVRAIRAFLGQDDSVNLRESFKEAIPDERDPQERDIIHRGLADIYFDYSSITNVDARGDVLRYRGYSVDELAERANFEETSFLLVHDHLPTSDELACHTRRMRGARAIPDSVQSVVSALGHRPPLIALQAAVAALADDDPTDADADLRVIAQFPILAAAYHRLRSGNMPLASRPDLGHGANYLYLLHGELPTLEAAAALEQTFVILADHSSSASTFTARIAAGTNASIHAVLSSAIGVFSGPLHGGAVDRVVAMAEAIGSPEAAADFVEARQARREIVYGFGHRIYRTVDPRSFRLRTIASRMGFGDRRLLDILDAIPPALAHQARLGLDVNVDFYASAVFEALGIPRDMFGATFMVARMAGLVAHVREQRSNNILIRPQLMYDGPGPRAIDRGFVTP